MSAWTTRATALFLLSAWVLLGWRVFAPPLEVVTPPLGETYDMVYCRAGELRTELGGRHPVGAFYIDRFEVTGADYAAFLRAVRDHPPPRDWDGRRHPPGGRLAGELPVTWVTHLDARAYAEWAEKRLPTALEWEWAARGPSGLAYPWGSGRQSFLANTLELGIGRPTPVGLFASGRSPFGAYDMVGNVAEWTATRGGWEFDDRYFVLGGSFVWPVDVAMDTGLVPGTEGSPNRILKGPNTKAPHIGFRCVLDVRAVNRYQRTMELAADLGIRDPIGWLLDVRPAKSEIRSLGPVVLPVLAKLLEVNEEELVRTRISDLMRELGHPDPPR